MTYSIDIPLLETPDDSRIIRAIYEVFDEFGVPHPKKLIKNKNILEIEGAREDEYCWFNVMYFEPCIREYPEFEFMGGVETRGSWLFAGLIAYAICKNFGKILLNDSGARIGNPGIYSAEEFRRFLESELAK